MKEFSFQSQLSVGARGESIFYDVYPLVEKADGRKFDFTLGKKTIELKTDTYPMSKTPNFFIEEYSDLDRKKHGGPFVSLDNNVDFFVYFYLEDMTFFWFDTKELVKFIKRNKKKFKTRQINNKGWTTTGYLVPRDMCEKVIDTVDVFLYNE